MTRRFLMIITTSHLLISSVSQGLSALCVDGILFLFECLSQSGIEFSGIKCEYMSWRAKTLPHLHHSSYSDPDFFSAARIQTLTIMAEAVSRPRVFLDISVGTEPIGRLVIELFTDKTPKTSEK